MKIFTLFFGYFVCGIITYIIYDVILNDNLFSNSRIVRIVIRLSVIIFWPIFLILLIYYIIGLLLFELFIDIIK